MNQNYKILAVALAIFFISMSFWMLVLGSSKTSDRLNLSETAEQFQSNLIYTSPPEEAEGGKPDH